MLGIFTSCAKEKLMKFSGKDRLLFKGEFEKRYSFVYKKSSVTKDTIWLDVETLGNIYKTDRKFKLEQIIEKNKDNTAIAGTHYNIEKEYIIKANAVKAKIPIVLIRDVSLREKAVRLKLKIVENKSFKHGEEKTFERLIIFSDKLQKPSKWDFDYGYGMSFKGFFGEYGEEKHRFMINTIGKVDDDFIEKVLFTGGSPAFEKANFYVELFKRALDDYNKKHKIPLREEPKKGETKGKLVKF
jgi:hypothetical protein